MLFLALLLLAVLGVVAVGTRRLKWPAEHLPLWALALFISALYGAALSGVLYPACLALLAGGLGLLGWQLVTDRRHLRALAAAVLTPGVVLFVALSLAAWLKYQGAYFWVWDDFSHWGLVIKELVATHRLGGVDGAVTFKDYPPGTALWQYALVALTGWSEGAAMVAQTMLLWAVLATMLTGVAWRRVARIVATVLLFYLVVISFGHDVASMLVDHVLAAWMAGAIVIWWTSRDDMPAVTWRLLPVLFALPLIKTPGFALALTAAGAVALATWLDRPRDARPDARKWLLIVLLVVAPVLAFGSWKLHVAQANFPVSFQLTADATAGASPKAAAERQRVTVSAFGRALVVQPIGVNNIQRRPVISTLGWLGLLGLGLFVVWHCLPAGSARRRFVALHLGLALGAVVYVGGLLWLYLTAFNAYEGPRLASFDRYMGLYALAWGLVLAVQLFEAARAEGVWRWVGVGAIAVFIGLLVRWGPYDGLSRLTTPAPPLLALRQELRANHLPDPGALAPDRRRVYVVWQNTSGLEFWILRYEMAPRLVGQLNWSREPFSLGEPYGAEDVFTRPMSARAWSDMLKVGFDYVLIGHADAGFARHYGRLFPGGVREGLYTVVPQPDGWVALSPVSP